MHMQRNAAPSNLVCTPPSPPPSPPQDAPSLEAFDWLLASPEEAKALRPGAFALQETVYSFRRMVRAARPEGGGQDQGKESVQVPLWRTAFAVELAPAVLVLQNNRLPQPEP